MKIISNHVRPGTNFPLLLAGLVFLLLVFFACRHEPTAPEPPEYQDGKAIGLEADHAMVAGSSGRAALEAGLEVMREGGNACDAALTAALGQIALSAGCWNSYAGVFSMVYYRADSNEVFTIAAPFKPFRNETEPLSIPQDTPSGRTALVSGFMKGVEEAHRKCGSVSFARIFAPSIRFAEDGVILSDAMGYLIRTKWAVLSRLPATRAVFTKANGIRYSAGDLFRQPALAATLRRVVRDGADHMHTGDWAKKFVEIVRAEGGRVVPEDLAEYRPAWTVPARTLYNGCEISAVGYPCIGGVSVIAGLNIMEAAGSERLANYPNEAQPFYYFVKAARVGWFLTTKPWFADVLGRTFPGRDFSNAAMLRKETGRFLWDKILSGEWDDAETALRNSGPMPAPATSAHSDAVVAIDAMGNAASVSHTINTAEWGGTGIFVEGISIPDAGSLHKVTMYHNGNRAYIPDISASTVGVRNGRVLFAGGSPGMSIREITLQHIYNMVVDGLAPARSIARRMFMNPRGDLCQRVAGSDFSERFIDRVQELGQCLETDTLTDFYWVGILLDPLRGLFGGAPRSLSSTQADVVGY